ncbi:MAG: phosphoglycerate kinase [Candidatus Woesearchaeota archaeon]
MKLFSMVDLALNGRTILVRVDYNVPLKNNRVADNNKIKASLPTIKYLLKNNCKIVLTTHLGRPNGKFIKGLKTDVLAKELKRLLPKIKIKKLDDCIGKEIKTEIEKGKPKQIFLLENLRFYKGEEQDDLAFAHSLAELAEVYVNDAFAVSHRKHASVHAITKSLPSAAGLLMLDEIENLSKALHPKKPFTWIIGGAKLDKIDLMEKALEKANHVLIGGALMFSFLKAKGYNIGMSKVDVNSVRLAKKILKKHPRKIVLPLDVVIAADLKGKTAVVPVNKIPTNKIGFDIGPLTVRLWRIVLKHSHTVVWNGPLGYFEVKKFQQGTKEIAKILSGLKAVTIIGGGETSEAVEKFRLANKMTHVSTGGGASLEFLSGKKLPGIEALEENKKKFRIR